MDPKLPKKMPLKEVHQNIIETPKVASATLRPTEPSQSRNIASNMATSATPNRNIHGNFAQRMSVSTVNLRAAPASRKVEADSSTNPSINDPSSVKGNNESIFKRAAANKLETIAEPKEAKQPKVGIPDYYKLFCGLQEVHMKLINNYLLLKEQCADTQEMKKKYDEIVAEKDEKISILETDCTTNNALIINYREKCDELDEKNNKLTDELRKSNDICVELETTLENLRKDFMLSQTLNKQLQNTIQDLKGPDTQMDE
ncbi:uncharacterized protein [Diabrotica undecimpunctata]|uniref:uncharacterized protein n=1 Tax=Diabrotica undecimpunctata TaxID=50387 RepID=UPI003B639F0B